MKRRTRIFLVVVALYAATVIVNVSLGVRLGFDLDDTLMFTTPSFVEAVKVAEQNGYESFKSPEFWKEVNDRFDLGEYKKTVLSIALLGKVFGIKVVVITARPDYFTERVKEGLRWLTDEVYFTEAKAEIMSRGRYLCFFGDSDSDITEANEAGVPAIRVKRSEKSSYKAKYHPGKYGEFVLPFSVY